MNAYALPDIPAGSSLALVSLGCAKNTVDLQNLAGGLLAKGCTLSPDPERADVAIVNTCAFIASAREEAEREISRALALKAAGRYGLVAVAGCYPQRYPRAVSKFPGVDFWFGTPEGWTAQATPGLRLTGKAFAYLKIAEGCSRRCAYCAIPSIRGKYRSRPEDAILHEAETLLESGCRELVVVAQDPTMYGCDMPRERRTSLAELLWRLDELSSDDFWIRVLYVHPAGIDGGFVEWLVSARHAVRYADVPVQHTVPRVLERMGRRNAIAATREIASALREYVPGVTLRTTVMTGFPGETEAAFAQLRSDLRRMQFDRLGAFAYSPEAGTRAFKMRGRPSRATALERERLVMEDAAALWRLRAAKLVGAVRKALVVAPGVARLESQAPDVDGVVYLLDSPAARRAAPGDFVSVRLVRACGFDFEAEVAAPQAEKGKGGRR